MLRAALRHAFLATALLGASTAFAEIPPERAGEVVKLPGETGIHWVWVSDVLLKRSALFDIDSGDMLGMVDSGEGVSPQRPHVSRIRGEVYVVETVYARGHRGERTDLVTIYNAETLAVSGEVVIPPKRADNSNGVGIAALLDGDRFLVVFNQNPGMSVSVVDLESRSFVGEIPTGGCALVLPVGPRRFGMLCGDGSAIAITLDEAGHEVGRTRSAKFFDPTLDPLTEKGVRTGSRWHFASFEGFLHSIDFGAATPVAAEPWSLFSDAERRADWRIGGIQHLALHEKSGRLYSVVHQGEVGSHKDPGPEVWVYDLAQHIRVQRIELENLTATCLGPQLGIEAGGISDWLLRHVLPNPGSDTLAVTQDNMPLLLASTSECGLIGVYDSTTGAHLHDLDETGIGGGLLVVP